MRSKLRYAECVNPETRRIEEKGMTESKRFIKSLAKQVRPITLVQMKHLAELLKKEKNITENIDDYSLLELYTLCLLNMIEDDSEKEEPK